MDQASGNTNQPLHRRKLQTHWRYWKIMASPRLIVILILASIESAFGVLISTFIVTVLMLEWVRRRFLNACDLVLLTLGFSNVCLTGALYIFFLLSTLAKDFFINEIVHRTCLLICTLMINFNSWLTASLCVFSCFKIVDMKKGFFIWLKLRISKMVQGMILTSALVSVIVSLPAYWDSALQLPENVTIGSIDYIPVSFSTTYTIIYALASVVPLILAVLSLTLTLLSLWKHSRQMKQNASDVSRPKLDALGGAVKTMSCFLTLYMCNHLALYFLIAEREQVVHLTELYTIVVLSYATGQSLTIVLGHSKLKQAFLRMFQCKVQVGD